MSERDQMNGLKRGDHVWIECIVTGEHVYDNPEFGVIGARKIHLRPLAATSPDVLGNLLLWADPIACFTEEGRREDRINIDYIGYPGEGWSEAEQ